MELGLSEHSHAHPDYGSLYDEEYYRAHCGIPYERSPHWLEFFGGMASQIIRSLRPSSVFDAGCAWGLLVEAFWDRGVEAWGVDISEYAINHARPDMRTYCLVGSLNKPLDRRYDLITCIEVLEHMPHAEADQALKNLCAATDCILFSSTPRDFEEATHLNVQPITAWLRAFQAQGFSPDVLFDASFVCPHAFLVRRRPQPATDEILTLFNDKLQCQIDLIERRLQLAKYIASTHTLEAELAPARLQIAKLGELDAAQREQLEQWELATQDWITHEAELRGRLVTETKRLEDALNAVQADRASAVTKAESARETAEASRTAAESARDEALVFARQLVARHGEVEQLARHLNEEYGSPAWKLILKYRAWVNRARSNSLVRKVFEPGLLSLLRLFGIGASPPPPPPANPSNAMSLPDAPEAGAAQAAAAPEDPYQKWIRENEPDATDLAIQGRISAEFAYLPRISVITPVYKVPLEIIRETVASVQTQSYTNWELCLAHGEPRAEDVRRYLESVAAEDPRVKVSLLTENHGISGNSNAAFALASGEFIALLDHDDTLAPFALFEIVKTLNDDRSADFLYSDKDLISIETHPPQRLNPLFKPEWSPEVMLCANYLTHLCVLRSELVREIGGWRVETDGAQDWDLFLRFLSPGRRVRHIPKVLYHWRQISTSVAARGFDAKPFAAQAQLVTMRNYGQSQGWDVSIQVPDAGKDVRVHWNRKPGQSISLIFLSTGAGPEALSRAKALLGTLGELDVEVLLPLGESVSSSDPRLKPIRISPQSATAARLAEAVHSANGEILVFIDESVVPVETGWLQELTGPLQNPSVGIVGAKLLDPQSQAIRHAGIVFDGDGRPQYIYSGEPEYFYGIFGGPAWFRNWSAVSGACFAMRREVWAKIREESAREPALEYPRMDIDLCLKVQFQLSLRIVYNPHARMFQSQTSSLEAWLTPDAEEQGARYIRSCFPSGDPYFNPNLTLTAGRVSLSRRKTEITRLDYHAESQILVTAFDFTREQLADSKRISGNSGELQIERITWFLPEFTHPYYGGVHTILRFAAHFAEKRGVHSTFAILGNLNTDSLHRRIATVFPSLASAADVRCIQSDTALHDLPRSDAAIATLWTTAYSLLKFNQTRRKFYFIQDYESLFYPAGSTSALVEATYDFGFTGICNTVSLKEMCASRGGRAEYFDPCIDSGVFFRSPREYGNRKPRLLFCYARPGHPRNSFELMMATLKIVKQRLGNDICIVTAGADWDPAAYGLSGVLRNLGVLGYRATGALYRACDTGVVAMMTRHPSYLPMEMMACGCAVVTNRNLATGWLLKDGENCLLAEPSPTSTAETIEEVLRNSKLRDRLTTTAAQLVENKYSNWPAQGEKIFDFMTGELEKSY